MRDFVSGRPANPPPDPVTGLSMQPPGGGVLAPNEHPTDKAYFYDRAERQRALEAERQARAAGLDMPKFHALESRWHAENAAARDAGDRLREKREGLHAARERLDYLVRANRPDPPELVEPGLPIRVRELEAEVARLATEYAERQARAASLGQLVENLRAFLRAEGVIQ